MWSSYKWGSGRARYMIARVFLLTRRLNGSNIQKKRLLEWSVGSLKIRRIVNFITLFFPLCDPTKGQKKNMSIKI